MTRAEMIAGYVTSYWQWMRYRDLLKLSLVQSEILLALLGGGRPLDVRALAADLERCPEQVRRELKLLSQADLVTAEVPPGGRRGQAVRLTAGGVSFLLSGPRPEHTGWPAPELPGKNARYTTEGSNPRQTM